MSDIVPLPDDDVLTVRQAVGREPGNVGLRLRLAKFLAEKSAFGEAELELRIACDLAPGAADVRMALKS